MIHMVSKGGGGGGVGGKLRERHHLQGKGVEGIIILNWIFRKWDLGAWTGSIWLSIGTDGGHL
jgi:hypothetical protein